MSAVAAQTQPVAVAQSAVRARSPWILSPWADLALFVATPALVLPLFLLLKTRWAPLDMALLWVALGGVGHHLPGMMRAYGDRELFQRYKLRFVLAPIFLVSVCCLAAVYDLAATQVVAVFWALWHSLAQTYGFLRIYDAKVGSFAARTRRLDRAMCVAWFVAGAIFSAPRASAILAFVYQSGGPYLSEGFVSALRNVWGAGTLAVTALFLAHYANSWRIGQPQSPVKLALLAISIAFWWFCMTSFANVIVGIALFEVFHDSQYLGIVWVYNGNRLKKAAAQTSFLRFFFRRSGALIALYVGLVLLYGYGSYVVTGLEQATLRKVLLGVVLSSTLLHYYYDGFIWRVREKGTRESLGVKTSGDERETAAARVAFRLPAWARHGAYWALFAVPVGGFAIAQRASQRSELDWRGALAATVPDSATAQNNYGTALVKVGRADEAKAYFERALELDPDYVEAHANLAARLAAEGRHEAAIRQFELALRGDPKLEPARRGLAQSLAASGRHEEAVKAYRRLVVLDPDDAETRAALGAELVALGDDAAAGEELHRALELEPELARAQLTLGTIAQRAGRAVEAIGAYRAALAIDPGLGEARYDLALALHGAGQIEEALESYALAAELLPDQPELHYNRGLALQSLGRLDEAAASYERAIAAKPDYAEAYNNLALVRAARGETEQAIRGYERALELQPDYPIAHANLALALQARGELEPAIEHLRRAIELRPDYAKARYALGRLLEQRGELAEAQAQLERALAIEPGFAEARSALDSLRSR